MKSRYKLNEGIPMDDKDKLIYELQQKIYRLESRVEYLQGVLSEAKITCEKTQSEEIVVNIDFTEEDQGARILSEVITKNYMIEKL